MPGIIAFPTLVEQAADEFGWMFANAPERWHFAEYLTGLMVAERRRTNAWFAQTTDPSCLNRWNHHPGALRGGARDSRGFRL